MPTARRRDGGRCARGRSGGGARRRRPRRHRAGCARGRGRVVVVSVAGGSTVELDLSRLMVRRATPGHGAPRPAARREGGRRAGVRPEVVPMLADGRVAPSIDSVYGADEVHGAFDRLAARGKRGKASALHERSAGRTHRTGHGSRGRHRTRDGRATGRDGATVIATSRTLQHAEATRGEIAAAGPARAEAITLDVADSRRVEEVVRDVADRHGRIDVLVANAGVEPPMRRPSRRPPTTNGTRVRRQRPRVFAVRRGVLPVMPDGGAIVTVGSMNAFIAWPNDAATRRRRSRAAVHPRPGVGDRGAEHPREPCARRDRHPAHPIVPAGRRRGRTRARVRGGRPSGAWAHRARSRTASPSSPATRRRS